MDQVTAFSAYQSAKKNSSPKKKAKPKSKPQNSRPPILIPAPKPKSKKRKQPATSDDTPPPPQRLKTVQTNTQQTKTGSKSSITDTPKTMSKSTKGNASQKASSSLQKTPSSSQKTPSSSQKTPGSARLNTSNNDSTSSSVENGKTAFAYILNGYDVNVFMKENWEQSPLYIGREDKSHYDQLKVSTQAIDEMLRTNIVEFTKNIDITSYINGVRETHNPDGRALPASVWDFYRDGCSVRLINPATFMAPLQKFNATLQEYFHCLVGANIYLTPPNSQGFAPHYDDIEAFVLQIEGKKEWLLYPPRSDNETLPRESSGNFQPDEIGEPCFKQILEPGDLLYFPRGYIHQAKTVDNQHSLHVTLSVYQKTSYADLLEEIMKQALKTAIDSTVSLRKGVPLDIWNQFGATYSEFDQESSRRRDVQNVISNMFKIVQKHVDLDDAVDKMAMKFQHDALPPVLNSAEKMRTTFGTKPVLQANGDIDMPSMDDDTEVRLIRAHIARLAQIDDVHQLYYYADNSKEYHGNDLNFIEVEDSTVDIIKRLIQAYPKYIPIKNLSENIEDSLAIAYSLWDRGLLMTKKPLE